MAWIEKRPKGYIVRWREPSGKVRSASRKTHAEAVKLRNAMAAEISHGHYVEKEVRQLPFGEYARVVLEADGELAERTLENHLRALRLHLAPLANLPIEQVDANQVRKLFKALKDGGASLHVRGQAKKTLSKVCSAAVEEGILTRNPAKAAKVAKPPRRKVKPLTPEQVETVAAALPPRWRATVYLGAWGGLRISEVGALTRADIDWDRGGVHVPEVKSPERFVSLPDFVLKALRGHVLEYAGETVLFPTVNGNPINHWTIAPIMAPTGVRFHDLRHTAVAILIREGWHPRAIMERMGHSSITVTMNTYGHIYQEANDELARTLEKFDPGEMGKVIEL